MLILCFSILLNLFSQNACDTKCLEKIYFDILNVSLFYDDTIDLEKQNFNAKLIMKKYIIINEFRQYVKIEPERTVSYYDSLTAEDPSNTDLYNALKQSDSLENSILKNEIQIRIAEIDDFSNKFSFQIYKDIYFYFLDVFKEKLKDDNYELPQRLICKNRIEKVHACSNELLNKIKKREDYQKENEKTLSLLSEGHMYLGIMDNTKNLSKINYQGQLEDEYFFTIEEAYIIFKKLYIIKDKIKEKDIAEMLIQKLLNESLVIDLSLLETNLSNFEDNEIVLNRIINKYKDLFDTNGQKIVSLNCIDKVHFLRSIYDLFRRPDDFSHF